MTPPQERRDDSAVVALLTELGARVVQMQGALAEHIAEEPAEIEAATQRAIAAATGKAFPNDDPEGHRLWHEEVIGGIKAKKEFWQKMTFELTKLGIVGFLAWAGYQLWLAFLQGPHK